MDTSQPVAREHLNLNVSSSSAGGQEDLSSTVTITGVLRWDLRGPIICVATNKLESERSAPFNLTVYCKCCSVTRARASRRVMEVEDLSSLALLQMDQTWSP